MCQDPIPKVRVHWCSYLPHLCLICHHHCSPHHLDDEIHHNNLSLADLLNSRAPLFSKSYPCAKTPTLTTSNIDVLPACYWTADSNRKWSHSQAGWFHCTFMTINPNLSIFIGSLLSLGNNVIIFFSPHISYRTFLSSPINVSWWLSWENRCHQRGAQFSSHPQTYKCTPIYTCLLSKANPSPKLPPEWKLMRVATLSGSLNALRHAARTVPDV